MLLTVDTSVIISIVTNEISKKNIISVSAGYELIAPESLHWEVGNAFSAMLRRGRIDLEQIKKAIKFYEQIPIRFVHIDINSAMKYCEAYKIFAYDAYFIECAKKFNSRLMSLDKGMLTIALENKISVLEI